MIVPFWRARAAQHQENEPMSVVAEEVVTPAETAPNPLTTLEDVLNEGEQRIATGNEHRAVHPASAIGEAIRRAQAAALRLEAWKAQNAELMAVFDRANNMDWQVKRLLSEGASFEAVDLARRQREAIESEVQSARDALHRLQEPIRDALESVKRARLAVQGHLLRRAALVQRRAELLAQLDNEIRQEESAIVLGAGDPQSLA